MTAPVDEPVSFAVGVLDLSKKLRRPWCGHARRYSPDHVSQEKFLRVLALKRFTDAREQAIRVE
jgi:hypothetical protein